ncbi:TIGR02556 family CRISPR-associated protein [Caldicellulosiruptor morganii]|uniref:TIGR02556 family CRISPR-associated protein n=1 Tax=Caldicellulosiruptor morganii TaxID=1387555 RepID=A0ABY7BQ50_9FIRM|nr:TIGR02556 family CRISPR-associated protein [Caldicellulosiruptor morganii]WAM33900.1 TIGR02556 family CRISPR-associated protein [Caldicellulosiruptor morganii]
MIEAVAELGKFVVEGKSKTSSKTCDDNFTNTISSFLTPVESDRVLLICLEQKHLVFEYCGVEPQNPLESKAQFYLFSEGAKGGGTNLSPACILPKPKTKRDMTPEEIKQAIRENVENVFEKKVENWFSNKALPLAKKLSKQGDISDKDALFIQSISRAIENNREKIINHVTEHIFSEFEKLKSNILLTFSFDGKYIGEYEIFKRFLLELVKEKAGKSSSQNKTCSICKQKRENVSGTVNVFKFYTIDKPGFIKGGFSPQNAWKNFPVCSSCQQNLLEGRKYLEKNLKFNFYNYGQNKITYLLVPKPLFGRKEAYEELLDILTKTQKEIDSGKKLERLTNDEKEILEILSEQEDFISVTFLFMVPQQGAERIVLMIEDVFPSHLKKIFNAKRQTEKKHRKLSGEDETFTFDKIRYFFSKSNRLKKGTDLDSYFLEITESIFKKKPIDFHFLLHHFCRKLQDSFATDNFSELYRSCNYAMQVLEFLNNLEILKLKGDECGMSVGTPFDEILNEFPVASEKSAVKGIILTGALCDMLLRIQAAGLNKAPGKMPPFAKNLKGLRLKQSDIIALLPKIQNKLMEYSAFGKAKKLVAATASELLLRAPEDWKLSSDEVSFYFACGMNLGQKIKELAKKLTNDSEEQETEE